MFKKEKLYPTPHTPSSLAWDKLRNYYVGAAHLLHSGRQKKGQQRSFLLGLTRTWMLGPNANNSKLFKKPQLNLSFFLS